MPDMMYPTLPADNSFRGDMSIFSTPIFVGMVFFAGRNEFYKIVLAG